MKEYTCVKKNDAEILKLNGFVELKKIIHLLRYRKLNGKCHIEHYIIDKISNEKHIIALHFLKDFKVTGVVYPYANFQNNNSQSLSTHLETERL